MATSEWNTSYWIDQLARLADQKSIKQIYYNENPDILVDVDGTHSTIPTPPTHAATTSLSQDPFSLDNWASSPRQTTPTISLSQLLESESNTKDTSIVTIRFSELMNESPSKQPETIQINCSLTDLIDGTGGIQKAIENIQAGKKIEEIAKVDKETEKKSEVVSFTSLVKEEEELQKQRDIGLNVSAREFSLTPKKELLEQTRAGLNLSAKEFSMKSEPAKQTRAGLNISAKEFNVPTGVAEEWKSRLDAKEFVFKPTMTYEHQEGEVAGSNVNGTMFFSYIPPKQ
ncbi:hypothetical protein BD560DRAFT_403658 [Blakeslea trispora]|nr:hypothetical protein BD560DRAFT_403658 [Blakeslea trispora]